MKVDYWIYQVKKIETILRYFPSLFISQRMLGFTPLQRSW